jgi:hypothetical protein
MIGTYIIRDKASGKFCTGTAWHAQYEDAKMFSHAEDAIEVAKDLQDGVAGPVEVLRAYDYYENLTSPAVWSSISE